MVQITTYEHQNQINLFDYDFICPKHQRADGLYYSKGDCIIQWEGVGNFVNQLFIRQRVAVPPTRQPPQPSGFFAIILWFLSICQLQNVLYMPYNIVIIIPIYYALKYC